jgi:hypothetical protein
MAVSGRSPGALRPEYVTLLHGPLTVIPPPGDRLGDRGEGGRRPGSLDLISLAGDVIGQAVTL